MTNSPFITDEELRAAGVPELNIDALDRDMRSQKFKNDSRDRAAVEEVLAARGVTVNLRDR